MSNELPLFPEPGTRRAILLAKLLNGEQLDTFQDNDALELYDLTSRGWPLICTFTGLDTAEVRMEAYKLPHPTKRVISQFLQLHSNRLEQREGEGAV